MPQDVTCPRCSHSFPVTEARHAFTVACPRCEAPLTAEFKKPAVPPEAGQPHYELLVKPGALPGNTAPPPVPRKKKTDDDDEPTRRGGSAMVVLVSGGLGLLFVLGGLSLTGWYLFTQIDVETASSSRSGSSSSSSGSRGVTPKNTGPKVNPVITDPGFPSPPVFPPKPKDTFDLRPAVGPLPAIAEPTLPADPSNADLGGKVGQIAVGGGGRYLVMHFPDKGQLGLFDVSTAQLYFTEADNGDVRLAAGLSRAVVYSPGANIFRVYEIPSMKKQYDFTSSNLNGLRSIAMGSRTNGPLLGNGTFGDPVLIEVGANEMKEVEGSRKQHTGLHWNMLRAAPDGTAFTTFDGFRPNQRTTLLTVENRQWKVQKDIADVPFPGGDGNLYGNGVVLNRSGQDQRFGGVGAGSGTWFVPAASGTTHFLKVAPFEIGVGFKAKKTMKVTVHANRNSEAAVATVNLAGLPEFDDLMDRFGRHPTVALDQHLFLVPEAKLLVTLTSSKDRLVLRRLDLR
jgi:hypothetical protein